MAHSTVKIRPVENLSATDSQCDFQTWQLCCAIDVGFYDALLFGLVR